MKQRTVRLILDCMMCDAMTPEFKANMPARCTKKKRREAYKAREEIGKKVHSLGGKTPSHPPAEMSEHDRQIFS